MTTPSCRAGRPWLGPGRPGSGARRGCPLIEGIVQAVRAGDDPAIRILLHQLAEVADTEALLLLHRRLNKDLRC